MRHILTRYFAMKLDPNLYKRKAELLDYYRERADEALTEIRQTFGDSQYRDRASAINNAVQATRQMLLDSLHQEAQRAGWTRKDVLNNVLMLTHCCNVVMIDYRNSVWPYEYMTFSRRNGELWEPFCTLCFKYPTRTDIALFVPPLFKEVREALVAEIKGYIDNLKLSKKEKEELLHYYEKVWKLIQSGEIKLQLDLHFELKGERFVVDFKSGFGSNEKGNTNRLLLVGTIYKNIEAPKYRCLLLVRSDADQNNNYFKTLSKSGIWEGACGKAAYDEIRKYSGFDLKMWIKTHINWPNDLLPATVAHFKAADLMKYLSW